MSLSSSGHIIFSYIYVSILYFLSTFQKKHIINRKNMSIGTQLAVVLRLR